MFLIVKKQKTKQNKKKPKNRKKNYFSIFLKSPKQKKIQRGFLEIAFRNQRKRDGNTICSTSSSESTCSLSSFRSHMSSLALQNGKLPEIMQRTDSLANIEKGLKNKWVWGLV